MSVCSAAIKGIMDKSQCKLEYPSVACLKGIRRAGSAARARRIFGNSGFGKEGNIDIEIRMGSIVGYSTVAGSNAAGTCMRFRNRRFDGFPLRQE